MNDEVSFAFALDFALKDIGKTCFVGVFLSPSTTAVGSGGILININEADTYAAMPGDTLAYEKTGNGHLLIFYVSRMFHALKFVL